MEIINHPAVAIVAKYLIIIISGLLLNTGRKILKRITLVEYKLEATDFALEKHLQNGYSKNRSEKLNELIKNDNFINRFPPK